MRVNQWSFVLLATLVVAAASTLPTAGTAQTASSPSNAQTSAAATEEAAVDYHLAADDKLHITVFNETTLTGDFAVKANGAISFPLIGDVMAVGKTPAGLADSLAAKLADGYLKNPRVTVEVTSFRPFYIYGEVTKPGEYPCESGMSVLKAVALAQGFTYRADQRRIFLKRAGEAHEVQVHASADVPVEPGDTIRIAERYF